MEKFYQACFSRLGRNDTSSGWQMVNLSPGIPMYLKEFYENRQKGNQPEGYNIPKDINGDDLCLLEFIGNGNDIGISRVRYGLTDSFGRDMMFCHGFLFPNAYELLKDPNNIVGISDKNFFFSDAETSRIPTKLLNDKPMTVETALHQCGMDKQAYIEYVSCIFYVLANRTKTAIYIKTDGTDRMVRALMFLAYSAVPYCLRTKITATTFAGTKSKDTRLVMCTCPPESGLYIDPVSGENNILTKNLRNRWARYPFVDYFARNYDCLKDSEPLYFDEIEKWLTRMGNPYLQDMDAIRLAFDMIHNQDRADVPGLLYDWLSLPLPVSETLEQCVADLLRKAIDQNLDLGRDKEQLLFQRLGETSSRELIALGNQYQAKQLVKMPREEAVSFINSLTPESRVFNMMRENLAKLDGGLEILKEYYFQNAKSFVARGGLTYHDLEDFILTFSDLHGMEPVWNVIVDRALEIAIEQIHKGADYAQAAKGLGVFLDDNYKTADWEGLLRKIAEAYDHEFRENFEAERIDEYVEFYQDQYCGGIERFDYSLELVRNYQALREGKWTAAADYAAAGCPFNDVPMKSSSERAQAVKNLMDFALYCHAARSCKEIAFWCQMAEALGENPVELMVEKQARVFCDQIELTWSLDEDSFWTDEKLEWMCAQYHGYVEKSSDNTYKKSFEAMNRKRKSRTEEAKRIQKEMRRQSRMDQQDGDIDIGKFLPRGVSGFMDDRQENNGDYEESGRSGEHSRRRHTDSLEEESVQHDAARPTHEERSPLSGLSKFLGGIGGRGRK